MANQDTTLILRAIDSVRAEVTAAEGRVCDEVSAVERRLNDKIDELKRAHGDLDSEASELKLKIAAIEARGGSSLKRDGVMVGGSGALMAAVIALINWLTSAPPPRAERVRDRDRDRPVVAAPAPAAGVAPVEAPRAP